MRRLVIHNEHCANFSWLVSASDFPQKSFALMTRIFTVLLFLVQCVKWDPILAGVLVLTPVATNKCYPAIALSPPFCFVCGMEAVAVVSKCET